MYYKVGRKKTELREFFVMVLEEYFKKFQAGERQYAFAISYCKLFNDDQIEPEYMMDLLESLEDPELEKYSRWIFDRMIAVIKELPNPRQKTAVMRWTRYYGSLL